MGEGVARERRKQRMQGIQGIPGPRLLSLECLPSSLRDISLGPKTWEKRAAEASTGLAAGLLRGACLAGPSFSLTGLTPAATGSSGYWVCAAVRI